MDRTKLTLRLCAVQFHSLDVRDSCVSTPSIHRLPRLQVITFGLVGLTGLEMSHNRQLPSVCNLTTEYEVEIV